MAYHPPAIYGKFLCCHIELDAMITFCPFGEGAEYIRVTLNADNKGVQIESFKVNLTLSAENDLTAEQNCICLKLL